MTQLNFPSVSGFRCEKNNVCGYHAMHELEVTRACRNSERELKNVVRGRRDPSRIAVVAFGKECLHFHRELCLKGRDASCV